ncbi:MAG TPA: type 1 glutamine amidotransferase [Pseudonocardiaceae bacterium]|jgi:GMP synthase-like glutamine amidotransferase|nr:type 1 glutamine amidotransferase [Pseudonocardiaceae bacterium]
MRALCVVHDPTAGVGLIGAALREQGWQVDELPVVPAALAGTPNVDVSFPDSAGYDLLVPLGARWGAYEDAVIGRWLRPELRWLADAVAGGVAVFGICFGAQVLARALGGTVARSPQPEIGWVEVESAVPELIPAGPWFEWHFDRFTMPPGAVELARNAAAVQAFRIGRSMGVQFHPEVTTDIIRGWVDSDGQQVRDQGLDPADLLAEADQQAVAAKKRAELLVAAYLAQVFAP